MCFISGESIPIRLFMNGYDLTPTMRDVNKKFSVRYYLNLVLVDDEDRRYFKQQVCECAVYWRYVALVVVLWRLALSSSSSASVTRTSKCTCLIFGVSIGLDPG